MIHLAAGLDVILTTHSVGNGFPTRRFGVAQPVKWLSFVDAAMGTGSRLGMAVGWHLLMRFWLWTVAWILSSCLFCDDSISSDDRKMSVTESQRQHTYRRRYAHGQGVCRI